MGRLERERGKEKERGRKRERDREEYWEVEEKKLEKNKLRVIEEEIDRYIEN